MSLRIALVATLLLFACATPVRTPERPCGNALSIQAARLNGTATLVGTNICHVPIFFDLSLPTLQNMAPSRPLPVRGSLSPGASVTLVRLEVVDSRRAWSFQSAARVLYGTSLPDPDPNFLYAFPFGGPKPRRLIQGVDGKTTHKGRHRFAFDFAMPIGTPVLAAREGTVLFVNDGFPEGAFRPELRGKENSVTVLHEDGTIASYGHLSEGVPVELGARVRVGDLLGYSGNSGYSSGPHLHFEVATQVLGDEAQSIPTRFVGGVVPERGGWYGPQAR